MTPLAPSATVASIATDTATAVATGERSHARPPLAIIPALSLALALFGSSLSAAPRTLRIEQASPQGTVGTVHQVMIRFDEAATRLGDPTAPAPVRVLCDPANYQAGTGHWTNEREWVHEFAKPLPSGVRCRLEAAPDFHAPSGKTLGELGTHHFNTGGPRVSFIRPYAGMAIEEEQAFVLQLSSPASLNSLRQHLWCQSTSLGERIPVRLLAGDEREQVLKAAGLQPKPVTADTQHTDQVALNCQRRLSPGAQLTLHYAPGVKAPNGLAQTQRQQFVYPVREPFQAEMSCERENAQSACLPIRPITLRFNAPITLKDARRIRLHQGGQALLPHIDGDDQSAAAAQDTPDAHTSAAHESTGAALKAATDPTAPDVSPTASAHTTKRGDRQAGPDEPLVSSVRFDPFFEENAHYELRLPEPLHDASGRPLANAERFPLSLKTGPMPPLAKFAAAPFGIIERHANGPDEPALLPVTLRRIESRLGPQQLRFTRLDARHSDHAIIEWMQKVVHYDSGHVLDTEAETAVHGPLPQPRDEEGHREALLDVRALSLLKGQPNVETMTLPAAIENDTRPFEVVGIPLDTGFHVVEITSPRLGQALLAENYGPERAFHVRTAALVTNLGVHFKQGRENALAWVTTLDGAKPVAGAQVRLSTCKGTPVAEAITDAQGVAHFAQLPPAPYCHRQAGEFGHGYFVSARAKQHGKPDMAFIWSGWQRGIESWRFEVPTSLEAKPDIIAHTVLDRSLLRAGETLSMKHFVRQQTSPKAGGLALPEPAQEPDTLVITHVGSGQQYSQALNWQTSASGGRSAESQFTLPRGTKLGHYQISLTGHGQHLDSGRFRVEAFRLPVYQGQVQIGETTADALSAPLSVSLNYISGGPAAGLSTRVSVQTQAQIPEFPDHPGFRFDPPQNLDQTAPVEASYSEPDAPTHGQASQRLIMDKQPLTLDAQGEGQLMLNLPSRLKHPMLLMAEADYADPNGEIHTLQGQRTLWPAQVVAGIKADHWISVDKPLPFQALALNHAGRPQAGVKLRVEAVARTTTSSRKRMVGGFYRYEHQTHTRSLGTLCEGRSDAQGLMSCTASLTAPGEVELIVLAEDDQGHQSMAAQQVWVTGQGEQWFEADNHDRMDVLAEKKQYEPGETARFQVRMPFREATALVAIEREGIIETRVVPLSGHRPSFELKVADDWSPNVYVSVLALRGRLREVPWYPSLRWGIGSLSAWWQAWQSIGQEDTNTATKPPAPTALIDLSKPAFRFGMAEIRVGGAAHRLDVRLSTDQTRYPVRGKAQVQIEAKLPDGQPAAHAEVALAAVDQALLALMPNQSWSLLNAMLARRPWGVETATAQMEVVGRRHYGRKAVPAGGDGGPGTPTRELFDTLLYWNPRIRLDAEGRATVSVPLNDSISQFRLVAIADHGTGRFGTGQTGIQTTQDLQIISALPPVVRGGDQLEASISLRNTTDVPMQLTVKAQAGEQHLAPRQISLPAGATVPVTWAVSVPDRDGLRPGEAAPSTQAAHGAHAGNAATAGSAWRWQIEASDPARQLSDRVALTLHVLPAVPVMVQQASLLQLDKPYSTPVAPPADALPARGGLSIGLQARLVDGLPAVQDWFKRYPYSCLEQQASKALVLADQAHWQALMSELPAYLDEDALAHYFPPSEGAAHRGSEVLSSWLLAASDEAARLNPAFALPEKSRQQLINGLTRFVEGRLKRERWAPQADLTARKLMVIEALSRYGAATANMISNLTITPRQWPTHALIDWLNILKRMPALPRQASLKREALQLLRTRLSYQGSRLVLQHEAEDNWWWLMVNGDVNAARLLLTVLDEPSWHQELGRLATGLIGRQQAGRWQTTTANLWGWLALHRFSMAHESTPVEGLTQAVLNSAAGSQRSLFDWNKDKVEDKAQEKVKDKHKADDLLSGHPLFFEWPTNPKTGASHAATRAGTAVAPRTATRPSAPVKTTVTTGQPSIPHAGVALTGGTLSLHHEGTGKPWVSIQSLAAVPRTKAISAGYRIEKRITPVMQQNPALPAGHYSRGDILRVRLTVRASAPMTWVVFNDPIPAGATILGSGLGRDSAIATRQESTGSRGWLAYEERSFEAFRSYFEWLPQGESHVEYTIRLNQTGRFLLPPSRVEALYAPERFGESPNAPVTVVAPAALPTVAPAAASDAAAREKAGIAASSAPKRPS
ncbi:MAG: MG2 domain-containing protein [Lautropia sp.]|nr:MG2 domain-containing protein [Lautropia sp.]